MPALPSLDTPSAHTECFCVRKNVSRYRGHSGRAVREFGVPVSKFSQNLESHNKLNNSVRFSTLKQRSITGLFFGGIILGTFYFLPEHVFSGLLAICWLWILWCEWPVLCARVTWLWWLTPIYPVLPCLALILLNESGATRSWLGWLIILAYVHDTAAYVAGNLMGRHVLAPKISPNKTWEGVIAGLVSAIALLYYLCDRAISVWAVVLLAIIISFLFISGDLFESWLKRSAGLKDSGSLLPGHGGLLDRFDGLLFAGTGLLILIRFHLIDFLMR